MNQEPNSLVTGVAIASTIPWVCTPVILLIAFHRLWKHTDLRAYAILSTGCLFFIASGVLSSLAKNVPRFGKTMEQVAVTSDIAWLKSISVALDVVVIWIIFIGAIGLLRYSKSCPPA
jgi:hypothetical protein